MIRIGPLVIMSSKTLVSYKNVVKAAWPLHQAIWYDQQHDYSGLIGLDATLSDALSRAPIEDAPK